VGGNVDTHFFAPPAHRPARTAARGPRAHRRLTGPALGPTHRGSAAAVIRRARPGNVAMTGSVPDLRVVHDLVAVGLQPCSHVLRRPGCGSRAVAADGEDVIGHGVSQHGSGVHGTKSAASSASCRPGLRPDGIPAGRNSDRGGAGKFRRHRLLKFCDSRRTTDGHPRLAGTQGSGSLEGRFDARRNDNGGGLAESWAVPRRRGSGAEMGARPAVVREGARLSDVLSDPTTTSSGRDET
jgi:hypothetical protein